MPFPENAKAMWEAGYRFLDHGVCIGCDAPIEWWLTPQKRRIPMNLMPEEKTPAKAHWATCNTADTFRKKQVAGPLSEK
jgi:hypothetical protein